MGSDETLHQTPLYGLHEACGARFVPYAGYAMPVQYKAGVMREHLHTRAAAGLFDVSHMGQIVLRAKSGDVADAAAALERLVPVDVLGLAEGRQRYAFFTNDQGGVLDDLMISRFADHLLLVVNAATKAADLEHLKRHLGASCELELITDRALLALQGPRAEEVLAQFAPKVRDMRFMDAQAMTILDTDAVVSRSGYTGEDGFEFSIPAADAERIARTLLEHEAGEPIGLGARDSLRLEAGLCLYGNDLDPETTPVEAALVWALSKARRPGGARAGGYPGAEVIECQLSDGVSRTRVGIKPDGRAPMRAGTPLFVDDASSEQIGVISSGGFGPSCEAPVAMGYIPPTLSDPGTPLSAEVRGKRMAAVVAPFPSRHTATRENKPLKPSIARQ